MASLPQRNLFVSVAQWSYDFTLGLTSEFLTWTHPGMRAIRGSGYRYTVDADSMRRLDLTAIRELSVNGHPLTGMIILLCLILPLEACPPLYTSTIRKYS